MEQNKNATLPEPSKQSLDFINYQINSNSKHEFGIEYKPVIPTEEEVRFLGLKRRECALLVSSLNVMKSYHNKYQSASYKECKPTLDELYACYTNGAYGKSIDDAPDYSRFYLKKFSDCFSQDQNLFNVCSHHFFDLIRAIYRRPGSELSNISKKYK
jgi:hypothetical protein